MARSPLVRTGTLRVLSALVTVLLAIGLAGLTASPASADPVPPATAPRNVTLTWDGTTSLTARWQPSAELGNSPAYYAVNLRGFDADGALVTDTYGQVAVSGSNEFAFTSLATGDRYEVDVVLYNYDDPNSPSASASTPAFPMLASDIELWSRGQNVNVSWPSPRTTATPRTTSRSTATPSLTATRS